MSENYIGIMSGTSCDGIDAILVNFDKDMPVILASHSKAFDSNLREKLLKISSSTDRFDSKVYEYDVQLGKLYAKTVLELLDKTTISVSTINAIGCHGQTISHQPNLEQPYTVQIGDPNTIAYLTNITTVSDFRRKDVANRGQGAPLTPIFHQHIFAKTNINRAIINIGGISNITFLNSQQTPLGFDTGPGNSLLDLNAQRYLKQPFDTDGQWAATGQIIAPLLTEMLQDKFFNLSPPKSTGKEKFNEDWLLDTIEAVGIDNVKPNDLQATLVELTTKSIARAINQHQQKLEACYICGGGAYNKYLMKRLALNLSCPVFTTEKLGISPQWVEATAFAWLAKQTVNKKPLDLRKITGSAKPAVLGGIYYP